MSGEHKRFSQRDRDRIFEADRIPFTRDWAVCRYCWRPVHRSEFHIAHELPVKSWRWMPDFLARRLGRDADWNVGVAHPACNLKAGARPMTLVQSISFRIKLKIIGLAFAVLLFAGVALWLTS